jgi:hypothetical protein
VVAHRYDLGRRRNVLEQAENVGIEYLDIDVERSSPPVVASNCGPTAVTKQMS